MRYQAINPELFKANRKHFVRSMKKGSVAVFVSNDIITRSADSSYAWRQNPDLFYLTGIDQEETFLVLFPDAPEVKYREVLFIRQTNDVLLWWEGKKHTMDEARRMSGIETIIWSYQFDEIFNMLMHYANHVYLNTNEHDRSISMGEATEVKFARKVMHDFPLHKYERSAPILHELRSVK